jgi:hypothetical protein
MGQKSVCASLQKFTEESEPQCRGIKMSGKRAPHYCVYLSGTDFSQCKSSAFLLASKIPSVSVK